MCVFYGDSLNEPHTETCTSTWHQQGVPQACRRSLILALGHRKATSAQAFYWVK